MEDKFDIFLEILLSEYSSTNCDNDLTNNIDVYSKEVDKEFRKILDRMATEIIYITFDNERSIKSMAKLSTVERIIIVFHIVLGMKLFELSALLIISVDNVYARKYRALNLLRKFMNEYY